MEPVVREHVCSCSKFARYTAPRVVFSLFIRAIVVVVMSKLRMLTPAECMEFPVACDFINGGREILNANLDEVTIGEVA